MASIVVTMLPDTPDVNQVVLGEGGVFRHLPRGTLLIDMSTIQPDGRANLLNEAKLRVLRYSMHPSRAVSRGLLLALSQSW